MFRWNVHVRPEESDQGWTGGGSEHLQPGPEGRRVAILSPSDDRPPCGTHRRIVARVEHQLLALNSE